MYGANASVEHHPTIIELLIGQLSADRLAKATYSTRDPSLLHMKCTWLRVEQAYALVNNHKAQLLLGTFGLLLVPD